MSLATRSVCGVWVSGEDERRAGRRVGGEEEEEQHKLSRGVNVCVDMMDGGKGIFGDGEDQQLLRPDLSLASEEEMERGQCVCVCVCMCTSRRVRRDEWDGIMMDHHTHSSPL